MKVWDTDIGNPMGVFFAEHGVDMPRAWSRFLREENCVNDRPWRTFAEFLKAEYPVQYTAWRIISGNK
jgi:hypothetical protein